jgi:hypothetical protein
VGAEPGTEQASSVDRQARALVAEYGTDRAAPDRDRLFDYLTTRFFPNIHGANQSEAVRVALVKAGMSGPRASELAALLR